MPPFARTRQISFNMGGPFCQDHLPPSRQGTWPLWVWLHFDMCFASPPKQIPSKVCLYVSARRSRPGSSAPSPAECRGANSLHPGLPSDSSKPSDGQRSLRHFELSAKRCWRCPPGLNTCEQAEQHIYNVIFQVTMFPKPIGQCLIAGTAGATDQPDLRWTG